VEEGGGEEARGEEREPVLKINKTFPLE